MNNKHFLLLVSTATLLAVTAKKPSGDTLKFKAGANSKHLDQIRIITTENSDYAGDRPSVWYKANGDLGSYDPCTPDDPWINAPADTSECCDENRGFQAWIETTNFDFDEEGVYVDYVKAGDANTCERFETDRLEERAVLPAGTYNSYMFHIKAEDNPDPSLLGSLAITSLVEFHGQTIKAIVYTNGAYRTRTAGDKNVWDRTAYDGSTATYHLDDTDIFAGSNMTAYGDAKGDLGRGIEGLQLGTSQYININCDTVDTCDSGTHGDPHFKTWKQEHFEYHGQCDLVLTKDDEFADGLGLDVQIRTKLVRFWSYIKSVAIRIGDDILEIQGTADWEGLSTAHYWMNFEYQGDLSTVGGFPVDFKLHEIAVHKRWFTIDLSSKYPGVKIVVTAWREFIRIDFENPSKMVFGNTVGMLGDFKTGATLARDGFTVLDDFSELGNEWQVLPSDDMLFHDTEQPQFPNRCIEPEDPRGERRRRLGESEVTEEKAEAACASLKNEGDRKDCIYDILATQDLEMVGAY